MSNPCDGPPLPSGAAVRSTIPQYTKKPFILSTGWSQWDRTIAKSLSRHPVILSEAKNPTLSAETLRFAQGDK